MGWLSESEESNIVSFMWNTPPAAPQNMDANAADSNIILRWEPVSKHVDGSAISESVKYQVFRNSGDGAFNPIGQLVSESQFVDTQVTNGKAYQYKVQAVTVYEKGQVGGGASELVEAIPMDQTPPPVPEGVQGIRTTRGVKVLWNRVKAQDVGGYRIYRRLPEELTPVKVGEVGVISTIFDDNTAPAADSWYYSVTSIDKTEPPNESEPSAEVKVRN